MKFKKILSIAFAVIAVLGVVLAFTGRIIAIDHPSDYREKQEEIKVPEEIYDVWVGNGKIYVCYRVASCVNVYDLEGNFLWAVSAPYIKTASFLLTETELIIYNAEAFVYNVENGSFIEVKPATEITFPELPELPMEPEEIPPQPGDIVVDWYTVSVLNESGQPETVIALPTWYWIFNFYVGFIISAIGSLGLSAISLVEKTKAWLAIRSTGEITHPQAKKYIAYISVTTVVQFVYALINIFVGVALPVFLLTAHFAIGGVIMYNLIENLSCTEYEAKLFDFLKAIAAASFIVMFLSLSFCF